MVSKTVPRSILLSAAVGGAVVMLVLMITQLGLMTG
jgi:hypothetical protein